MDFTPAIATVRAFNRGYTRVIGVLDEGLLRSPYTLTEVRVLFEIAHDGEQAAAVARIREALSLDAGYLSRILGRFESEGLIVKARSGADARRSAVELTPKGRIVISGLEDRSNEQVSALLARLGHADRAKLVEAMGQISSLLNLEPPRGEVTLRAPQPGDYGWVVERHGTLYAKERGWDVSFEALVAGIVADYATAHDPEREAFWIAEVNGQRVGCIACVAKPADPDGSHGFDGMDGSHGPDGADTADGDADDADDVPTAQLRLLLVDPVARGLGLGALLVDEVLEFARRAGYRRIVLYTVDGLTSARKIYEAVGFRLAAQEAVRKYGHDIVEQHWVLDLAK